MIYESIFFSARVVNIWNSLPNSVVDAYTVNAFKALAAHNTAQNRPDNFPFYPLDNHHWFGDVYLREGEPYIQLYTSLNCRRCLSLRVYCTYNLSCARDDQTAIYNYIQVAGCLPLRVYLYVRRVERPV